MSAENRLIEGPGKDKKKSGCFPIPLCTCLPRALFCVPENVRVIHDWTHLALGIVILHLLTFGIWSIVRFITMKMDCFKKPNVFGIREIIVLTMFCLIGPWCYATVKQFDERVVEKRERLMGQKMLLTQAYHEFISKMNDFLEKSLEYNTSMAETLFQGKYRMFHRWLVHVKAVFPTVFEGNQEEHKILVANFRVLCLRWFAALQECSIDPVNHPWEIPLTVEDMMQFDTIPAIVDYCLSALDKAPKVDVDIQRHRQEGRQMLTENGELQAGTDTFAGPGFDDPGKDLDRDLEKMKRDQDAGMMRTSCCPSWIRFCEASIACCKADEYTSDGWPRECGLICIRVLFSSPDQVTLLFAWFLVMCIGGLNFLAMVFQKKAKEDEDKDDTVLHFVLIMIPTGLFFLCLFWLLVRFEDIDLCEQLDRETKALKGNTERVKEKDEAMRRFWTNVQELNGVWLYRTIPRLDLLETISHKLEDGSPQEIQRLLPLANQKLADLEDVLGNIESWKGSGMAEADKKRFAQNLKFVHQQGDLPKILDALDALNTNNVNALKQLPGYDATNMLKRNNTGIQRALTRNGTDQKSASPNMPPAMSRGASPSPPSSSMKQTTAPPSSSNIEMQQKPAARAGPPKLGPKKTGQQDGGSWGGGGGTSREEDDDGYLPMIV